MKKLAVVTIAFVTFAAFSHSNAPAQTQLVSGAKALRAASYVQPRSQIDAMKPRPASSAEAVDAASAPASRRRAAEAARQNKTLTNKQKLARFRSHPNSGAASDTAPDPYGYSGWGSSNVYTNPATSN